jgi:hypothetical protein
MGSVPVTKFALGAPYDIGTGYGESFGAWGNPWEEGELFQWVEQCLPVVGSNPVQCRNAGNLTIESDSLTITSGNCTITSKVSVDTKSHGASVAGLCSDGYRVGAAEILFGSINEQATWLASILHDYNFHDKSYSAVCSIDIAPSLTYRQLNFSRIASSDQGWYYGQIYHVNASSKSICVPMEASGGHQGVIRPSSSLLSDTALINGAAASWQLLEENKSGDGAWPTLLSAISNASIPNLVFSESLTQLEDILGLSNAIALGVYWGAIGQSGNDYKGQIAISGVRVGPGEPWAVVYILPSILSIAILIYLLIGVRRNY